jgi:hypothetical protein
MKRFLIAAALLTLAASSGLRAQEEKILTGPITVADLLDLPGWFGEEYLGYQPVAMYLDRIPDLLSDVDIICVLGTWCSDSRREVPRMIRILQSKNLPPEKMRMIGVDREKRSPNGEAAQYGVERVPTFIFIRGGQELGRIVETPLASLEKDMLGIIDPDAGKGEPVPAPDMRSDEGVEMTPEDMPEDERKRMEEDRQHELQHQQEIESQKK